MPSNKKHDLHALDARLTKRIQRCRSWKKKGLCTIITTTTIGGVIGGASFFMGIPMPWVALGICGTFRGAGSVICFTSVYSERKNRKKQTNLREQYPQLFKSNGKQNEG